MNKDEIIKDLSEKLEMERQVKKHEVLINASYKETITRLEDQLKFVLKTNETLCCPPRCLHLRRPSPEASQG